MTRSLRDFVPLTENTVNMYVCGPTVYNYIHIGNARSTVAFDTIRRYFEYCGYTVNSQPLWKIPHNLESNQRHKILVLLTTWMKSLHLYQS